MNNYQEQNMNSQTVFIGNGINGFSGQQLGWNDLLNDLMKPNQFALEGLPNVMAYEKIRLNWKRVNNQETSLELKNYIVSKLQNYSSNEMCKKILSLGFSNYITTNYDNTIENSFKDIEENNSCEVNNQEEKYYSLRRNINLKNTENKVEGRVWHIHGDINTPKSIMLGFNHYMGSAAKVDSYLKGTYKSESNDNIQPIKPIKDKVNLNEYDNLSWVELFFNSDVHIIGFGFDFYEIDLWNILTKRSRLKYLKNNIYYYTTSLSEIKDDSARMMETRKIELLKSLSVEVIEQPIYKESNKDYLTQWNRFINEMCKKMNIVDIEKSVL